MGQAAFIRISDLTKRFGDHVAVDGVSLEVAEGHTLALLGPSGCGKTTILRCIAGLETPEQGSIDIAGTVVFDKGARINLMPEQRELGIVFQSYAVWPHMSVGDNVGFPLKVRGVANAERQDRVARILDLVGLGTSKDKPATELSGGQQQRVALARALIHEPRLVLFDEPMSNLDAQLREQVRLELQVLQARLGFTAIYVTHDQAEAFALAETVVVMNRGKNRDRGPTAPSVPSPRNAVCRALPRLQRPAGTCRRAQHARRREFDRATRRAGCARRGFDPFGCSQRRLRRHGWFERPRLHQERAHIRSQVRADNDRRSSFRNDGAARSTGIRGGDTGGVVPRAFRGIHRSRERRGAARHSTVQRRAIRRSRGGFHQAAGLHRIPCTDQSLE